MPVFNEAATVGKMVGAFLWALPRRLVTSPPCRMPTSNTIRPRIRGCSTRFRAFSAARGIAYFRHSPGNRFLTLLPNMVTELNLTDMECGYKVFRRDLLKKIAPSRNRASGANRRLGTKWPVAARAFTKSAWPITAAPAPREKRSIGRTA
jgi:hypothetical protein